MRKFTASEINLLTKSGIDYTSVNIDGVKDTPVEYIAGYADFYGRLFHVDNSVLIPRIETEQIIQLGFKSQVITKALSKKHPTKITYCDIGTGSGVIGITMALELAKKKLNYNGYITDVSSETLKVSEKNIQKHFPKAEITKIKTDIEFHTVNDSKIKIFQSDLFEKYPEQLRFDLIFANLPYIPSTRISNLDSSVKDYEPLLALDGGENGVDLIQRLLVDAHVKLKKSGSMILEVDDTHDTDLWDSKPFEEDRTHWSNEIILDENDKTRFWVLKKV